MRAYFRERAKGRATALPEVLLRLQSVKPSKASYSKLAGTRGVVAFTNTELTALLADQETCSIQFKCKKSECSLILGVQTRIGFDVCANHAEDVALDWIGLCGLSPALGLNSGYIHPTADVDLAMIEARRRLERVKTAAGWSYPYQDPAEIPESIDEIYWWTAFCPEVVERVGRQRFLGAPANQVLELADGGILLRACPSAAEALTPRGIEARARVRAHVCDGVNLEAEIGRLSRRASRTAPFTATWDPETERLLVASTERVFSLGSRMALLRRFRNYRAPSPPEQANIESLLPPDWDALEALPRYRAAAEWTERWFRKESFSGGSKLKRLMAKRDPESLHHMDIDIWCAQYSKWQPELVEAILPFRVGHYLGSLIEQHLGGQWVPRRAYDERQIVAGGRVWFPLQRAVNCLSGPRSNVLRSSLYQYYKAIERIVQEQRSH